jgi:hypothetical protein
MEKMKAVQVPKAGADFEIVEREIPQPGAGEHVVQRLILLVGPYGVLGTGVVDAVTENPQWGITTAARRPVPTYRAQAAPTHVSVDLMDREAR